MNSNLSLCLSLPPFLSLSFSLPLSLSLSCADSETRELRGIDLGLGGLALRHYSNLCGNLGLFHPRLIVCSKASRATLGSGLLQDLVRGSSGINGTLLLGTPDPNA